MKGGNYGFIDAECMVDEGGFSHSGLRFLEMSFGENFKSLTLPTTKMRNLWMISAQ